MANVPLNDPNVDASAIVPTPVNLDHASAQPVGLGNGLTPYWIGGNIPNNQNGWIEKEAKEEEEDPEEEEEEEDPKEEEEDPKEDSKKDDDDVIEMDDEAEVIDPYIDDGSNNPPPLNSEDEETPPTSPIIPDVDGQHIPPIASFGQNIHFGESSSTANLLTVNSNIVPTGPMCLNFGTAGKRFGKMEKLMSKRIDTKGRMKKKFKEQDRHFVSLGCDNIEMDRAVRNVMSDLSGLKKLVKDLSNQFDEYEGSKVFEDKKSEDSFPLPLGSQDIKTPAEPSARPVPAPYYDDPYVVTRDAAIPATAAVATFGIDDDDDDTAPMDSQPYEPHGSPRDTQTMLPRKSTRGNPPPPLTQDTINQMIHESVEAAIRAEKTWVEIKVMTTEEFCPPEEIQRMEWELWNLRVKEMDISFYTTRFNELMILCPGMVPTEQKKVEAYIRGLSENIKGEVTSSEPTTLNKAIGHKARDCWSKVVATGENAQPIVTCYRCGEKGHIKTNCHARNNPGRSGARGQAYALRDGDQNLGPNVVMGTFLLNNRYARVLFDSKSDKSFVNVNFSQLIDIEPVKVDHSYEVELADGRVVNTNTILRGCALNLVNHLFEIDLMPIELGTFDVIIGMDWLILHDVVIVCRKKEVHVSLKKRMLVVKGDDCVSRLKVVSCIKVKKYVDCGSYLFVAQVIEKEPTERRLEDVPVICRFPDMFPEDLPRLPPPQQVEFKIKLVLGATHVARAPYL
uniref:Reverse transcriptase domain-containing protein n=1 Tax=Tanacetum cinerariifolium TaxID=118510 RepID=A0A699J8J0_TANCI|nr:reverse transcriptase domain-containing protein [Tanacetum cinerariifolium]